MSGDGNHRSVQSDVAGMHFEEKYMGPGVGNGQVKINYYIYVNNTN